jgi:type II secretion system protein I
MKLRTEIPAGSKSRGKRGLCAFTFAEVLAALVFMAIVIPVAMQGLQIANRAGVVAERKSMAIQLADRLLNEVIVTGNWRTSSPNGTSMISGREFLWKLSNQLWPEDAAMRQVTVEVSYRVQNQEYQVNISTLVKEGT